MPTDSAVRTTPRVERASPFLSMGAIVLKFVPSPPENRIKFSATTPIRLCHGRVVEGDAADAFGAGEDAYQ
ncbi:hypothetical protein ACQ86N_00910 [Puia sp. P3]|uniref:hypothetical protein n=1 Tax=Puia sp. P3 TaxID=3423952 RepID=UPI003D66D093